MNTTTQSGPRLWTIRPVEDRDTGAIVRLFEETFGKPVSEAWYRWKVLETPWRLAAPPAWIAVADERVIGHYGGTSLRFRIGTDEQHVVNSCDAMTASEFRRQGVLTALGEAAARAWGEAGAAFVIGLMTAQWGSRRQHLDHRDVFRMDWHWRPLRAEALVRRTDGPIASLMQLVGRATIAAWNAFAPLRSDAGITVELVQRPDVEFDRLWEKLSGAYEATLVRDRAWVTYRYADSPDVPYHVLFARRGAEPAGYLSYRIMNAPRGQIGWMVDLFAAPADDAARAALISAAVTRLRTAGARDARMFAAAGTAVQRSLRAAGFLSRRQGYDITIIPLRESLPWPTLRDPNRWLFAIGDADVL